MAVTSESTLARVGTGLPTTSAVSDDPEAFVNLRSTPAAQGIRLQLQGERRSRRARTNTSAADQPLTRSRFKSSEGVARVEEGFGDNSRRISVTVANDRHRDA